MIITQQLLNEVKDGLDIPVEVTEYDAKIRLLVNAVIQLADLPESVMDCELGRAMIIIGVKDQWDGEPAKTCFSSAFWIMWRKLYCNSLPEVATHE